MTDHLSSDTDVAATDTFWSRGGAWVVTQFPLVGAAAAVSRLGPRLPEVVAKVVHWPGSVLCVIGCLLLLAGLGRLGRQLTPFPKPGDNATLVQSGAFGVVRHPVYGGGLLAMLGWALYHGRWSGLLAFLVVTVFFDQKATREERWLAAHFPTYPAYQQRVRKLIPWLY